MVQIGAISFPLKDCVLVQSFPSMASRQKSNSTRFFFGISWILIIGVRLFWVFAMRPTPESDAQFYFDSARGMVAGLGYLRDGIPTSYWPVGYPAILAALFRVAGPNAFAGAVLN